MGLDIHYQAMPEVSELLTRAKYDPKFGTYLEFFKSYAQESQKELDRRADNQRFVDFIHMVRQLLEQHPGIEHRNLYPNRTYDMLYYLMSERRRRCEEQDHSQWVEKAILGGEILNERMCTTVGIPIRYLYPIEVSDIRDQLETVTLEMLRVHWNPHKMSEAYVYKIRTDADEDCFKSIGGDFENLKAFYTLISKHGEGVLTFLG